MLILSENEQKIISNLQYFNTQLSIVNSMFGNSLTNKKGNKQIPLFENLSVMPIFDTTLTVNRNNYYAYFNKFGDFLTEAQNNQQATFQKLFEGKQTIIDDTVKLSIRNILSDLSKIDDLKKIKQYSDTVKNTILFLNKPLYIYGLNIKDVETIYGSDLITENKISNILYNPSDVQLCFFSKENSTLTVYDIQSDTFKQAPQSLELKKNTALIEKYGIVSYLADLTGISFTLISTFPKRMDLKFTDNLYNIKQKVADNKTTWSSKYQKSSHSFVK